MMAHADDDMASIENEIRELILHSKSKRRTIFEPCNETNLLEYLSYVKEELTLHGIKYIYNPYNDLDGVNNIIQTLVRLVNAIWNLLMQYKEVSINADKLKERNYSLQQNNFFLNSLVEKIKAELEIYKNKKKQAEENERQIILKYESCKKELSKVVSEVKKLKKQLISKENQLLKQIKKLENDYAVLQDRAKGRCGVYISKTEVKDTLIEEYKAREKKYQETINDLQKTNRQLLIEVVNLKDELLSSGQDD